MLNKIVPDFSLPATGGQEFRLSAQLGRSLVIYFYPKDSTPGCTTEAGQFRDIHAAFKKLGCDIYGVSRDSLKSHENFKTKLDLPFELLVDAEEIACSLFGVIKLKNMYGKQVRGIERSTFLIDGKGVLRHEWRAVKADGHAAEVLAAAKTL
ncbi:MAG: peroxiredoxin [Proteobacteria bacterium]|nr:peroxiredoxin [Pseudomonadota bacterium]